MPYKNIHDRRAAVRRHYYANREYYIDKNNRRRRQLRKKINDTKSKTPCADCGKQYPYYVMDFDHLNDKEYLISKLINSNNETALEKEIKKCEIVCSNCHRIRSFLRLESNL